MKAEIISHLDVIYIVIPKTGAASLLLLEKIQDFNEMGAVVHAVIKTDQDILERIGPGKFCVEFLGQAGNQVNPFLYELFQVYINNNLPALSEQGPYGG